MTAAVAATPQLFSDPHSLLEHLDPILGQTGCIKNSQEAQKLVSVMKDAQLLVSKCILLNVVKATKAHSALEKFMDVGGWPILNLWLAEAKKTQNVTLMVEILQVLTRLPVSIATLKQGNMGKLIKQLSKQEHPEVKGLAGELLGKWMTVFREGQTSKLAGASPAAKSGSSSGDKSEKSERTGSTSGEDAAKPATPTKPEKKERAGKRDKKAAVPPVEASQPPPGPLVALGRPKEKTLKRPRDLLVQKGQLPPEKRAKPLSAADERRGKGPVESEGFMNALSTQAARMKEKKIRKASRTGNASKQTSSSSKLVGDEGRLEEGPPHTPTTPDDPSRNNEQKDTQDNDTPADGSEYKKKKRVSWAEEDNLVIVHYFEMDESERENVSKKSFLDAAQQEKMREREALATGLMFSRDRLIEMMHWQRPARMEGMVELVQRGLDSEQRKIQAEREEKVLAQLFLSKASLPPSAAEPDPDPELANSEPKLIPLMEPNAAAEMPPPSVGGPVPGFVPPDSPLLSPPVLHQPMMNVYEVPLGGPGGPPPPHGPHGPHGPPGPNLPPPHPRGGPPGDYYNYQQGFPSGPPGPPGPEPWGAGGYYGDPYFHGRGGPAPRRGMPLRGGFRGRGRGGFIGKRIIPLPADKRICKHFITHGCKLGTQCRFMHITPEELASKIANSNDPQQQQPEQLPLSESMDTSVSPDKHS